MSVALLYYTKHGATRTIAERVAATVDATVTEVARGASFPEAKTVAIGVPIYAGTAPRPAVSWLEQMREKLLSCSVYLFVVCLSEGAKAEQQLADGVPAWLVAHSKETFFVGGQVKISTLGFFERLIMKKVAGIETDVDRLNETAIRALITTLESAKDQ